MAQINERLRSREGSFFAFWCPGCEEMHDVPSGRSWTWNGNLESPTVHPSLNITFGHFAPHHKPGDSCWCTYKAEHPGEDCPYSCGRCHTIITDGVIHFQSDCTHALAGRDVPIPPLPDYMRDDWKP